LQLEEVMSNNTDVVNELSAAEFAELFTKRAAEEDEVESEEEDENED